VRERKRNSATPVRLKGRGVFIQKKEVGKVDNRIEAPPEWDLASWKIGLPIQVRINSCSERKTRKEDKK